MDDRALSGKRRFRGRTGARGFTLLELMTTPALITIVAVSAIPPFDRMSVNGNLRTAARDIMGPISFLKEKAMAQNTQLTPTFEVGNNRYRSSDMPTGQWNSPTSAGQGIQLIQAAFGAGSNIVFEKRGTLQQAGNIILTDSRGSSATMI